MGEESFSELWQVGFAEDGAGLLMGQLHPNCAGDGTARGAPQLHVCSVRTPGRSLAPRPPASAPWRGSVVVLLFFQQELRSRRRKDDWVQD